MSDLYPIAKAMNKEGWTMHVNNVTWRKSLAGWDAEVTTSHLIGQFRWSVEMPDAGSLFGLAGDALTVEEAQQIASEVLKFVSTMPADLIKRAQLAAKRSDEENARRRDEERTGRRR